MPTTETILQIIRCFLYISCLDFSMGYMAFNLGKATRKLLTICTPFGYFEACVLPQGASPSGDICQLRTAAIFQGMRESRPTTYMDDVRHHKGESWGEHLEILDEMFRRIEIAKLQVNIKKSKFGQIQAEFVGFMQTRTGYYPLEERVSAIMRIKPPSTLKELRGFLGVINFIKNHIHN